MNDTNSVEYKARKQRFDCGLSHLEEWYKASFNFDGTGWEDWRESQRKKIFKICLTEGLTSSCLQ